MMRKGWYCPMRMNPVYKREVMVSARSFRLGLILLVFNGILALVALLNMYSTLAQVRVTAEIQYTSFMDLYLFVAILEFVMLIFIMPSITAGSISGERERQTLELMLTTQMTPLQIVLGKLAASMSTMLLMMVSSFPIVSMVFVYGGVTMRDLAVLLLCFTVAALFVGSLGICCSALFRKSTIATAVTYGLMGIIVLGTFGINQFALYWQEIHTGQYLQVLNPSAGTVTSGNFLWLLLINPATTFLSAMMRMTGSGRSVARTVHWFGNHRMEIMHGSWIGISMAVQLLMAAIFLILAVRAVSSGKQS